MINVPKYIATPRRSSPFGEREYVALLEFQDADGTYIVVGEFDEDNRALAGKVAALLNGEESGN